MSNIDPTALAEQLIRAVTRAFYEDPHTAVLDVLIRDKFLRHDEMSERLSVPGKGVHQALLFLELEGIVRREKTGDSSGDNQITFWYIDYNFAVKVIMFRVHLLQEVCLQSEQH